MDLSEEYILMCKEAKEIQTLYPDLPERVGCYFQHPFGHTFIHRGKLEEYSTWLPRQDQLQEMMKEDLRGKFLLDFTDSGVKVEEVKWSMSGAFGLYTGSSFEQIWLKWAMDIKFNKKWNGKTWEAV